MKGFVLRWTGGGSRFCGVSEVGQRTLLRALSAPCKPGSKRLHISDVPVLTNT